jgi:uncharacterized Zn-finger protein
MKSKNKYCCDSLKYFSTLICELHKSKYDCPDVLIDINKNGTDYRILIHDGGSSGIEIEFCPWCGKKLK